MEVETHGSSNTSLAEDHVAIFMQGSHRESGNCFVSSLRKYYYFIETRGVKTHEHRKSCDY